MRGPITVRRLAKALLLCALLVAIHLPAARADGEMEVTDSGVGRAVVDRELLDRGDSFDEGGEVWFWTRVAGGTGQVLRHAWLRQGEEVHVQELEIGAEGWRTWSKKRMHPGSVGDWAVEARDAEGRVLARHEFRCVLPTKRED